MKLLMNIAIRSITDIHRLSYCHKIRSERCALSAYFQAYFSKSTVGHIDKKSKASKKGCRKASSSPSVNCNDFE